MIIKSSKSFSRMRCAFPWNESKKNWKMNTTAAHLLISSLAGVTNQSFLLKNALKSLQQQDSHKIWLEKKPASLHFKLPTLVNKSLHWTRE